MNLLEHNRRAWNNEVEKGNQWTLIAPKELIERARGGNVHIVLTPTILIGCWRKTETPFKALVVLS